ncbi:MAG TPA: cytochrome c biogenesis protein CcsA [Verrucomicrobiae bacterium]|nr:cytochrome c biogenesis protein CcsA [Verrucomicrobiae bacterium]
MKKNFAAILAIFLSAAFLPAAKAAEPAKGGAAFSRGVLKILEEIPVQQGGRVKPFQSFAQEAVLYVTGRQKFGGEAPTALVWEWMSAGEAWASRPIIPVSYHALRKEFGLMLVNNRISAEVVLQHGPFTQLVKEAAMKRERKDKLTVLEKKRLELYERAVFFENIAQDAVPGFVAHPEDPRAGWLPVQSFVSVQGQEILGQFFSPELSERLTGATAALLKEIRDAQDSGAAVSAGTAEAFSQSLGALFESRGIRLDKSVLGKEITYLRLRPFHLAWMFYFLSLIVSLAGAAVRRKGSYGVERPSAAVNALTYAGLGLFAAAFSIHTFGFVLRCMVAGRPPVTNMYESMIWVSWAAAFISLILYFFYKNLVIRNSAAVVAGFALLLAQSFPVALNPAISPLVPVLRNNMWLTIHVLTITMSYGAFLLAWALGHGTVTTFAFSPENVEKQRRLSQYLYRTLQVGVVLLAAGTILGGVWANYSWGRFWGWDPKETWALIALLGYLVVLHARFAGWAGNFGIALGSCFAFLGVLMAWYGVNFVLGAGLHSYGFGGGGIIYVLAGIAADLALLGGLAWKYKKNSSKKALAASAL